MVNNLLDYEVACKILLGAAHKKLTLNPCDYVLSALGCKLVTSDPNEPEIQHILHYIHNSAEQVLLATVNLILKILVYTQVKILGIHKIFDEQKEKQFNPDRLANRRFLWHGTGAENLIGVLKLGLVPAPFQSAQSGQLFGQVSLIDLLIFQYQFGEIDKFT